MSGDIVKNLVLNTKPFVSGARDARRANKEMTAGITSDITAIQKKLAEAAEASVRQGGHGGRVNFYAKEEVRLLKERAEIEQRITAARRAALGPIQRQERALLTQEQQLRRVRGLIDRVTQSLDRQGKHGSETLTRPVAMENQLTEAKRRQAAMYDRARMATVAEGAAAQRSAIQRSGSRGGVGAAAGGASFAGLAYQGDCAILGNLA